MARECSPPAGRVGSDGGGQRWLTDVRINALTLQEALRLCTDLTVTRQPRGCVHNKTMLTLTCESNWWAGWGGVGGTVRERREMVLGINREVVRLLWTELCRALQIRFNGMKLGLRESGG